MNKRERNITIAKIIALILFVGLAVFIGIKYAPQFAALAENPQSLRDMLASYGGAGIAMFIGIQILQVIVAALPGEVTQLAGGYIYGIVPGLLYSIVGITIGSALVFYIARFLGASVVNTFVPKEMQEKFKFLTNNPKSTAIMFTLFLIPGMPKDFLSYFAGITPIRPTTFLVLSSVARIPGIFASTYIGANLQQGNLTAVVTFAIIAVVLVAIGFFMKDRILGFLENGMFSKKVS